MLTERSRISSLYTSLSFNRPGFLIVRRGNRDMFSHIGIILPTQDCLVADVSIQSKIAPRARMHTHSLYLFVKYSMNLH
jgi:hypothetical protein